MTVSISREEYADLGLVRVSASSCKRSCSFSTAQQREDKCTHSKYCQGAQAHVGWQNNFLWV